MKNHIPSPWERLESLIYENGFRNIKQFARAIGLDCVESLYQIKRLGLNISPRLAAMIGAAIPGVDEGYLVTGKRAPDSSVRIPYYTHDPVTRYRNHALPDNYITMPYGDIGQPSFATANHEQEPIVGAMLNSVLIVEEVSGTEIKSGKPHLIEYGNTLLLRFIEIDPHTGNYKLYSDNWTTRSLAITAADLRSAFALRFILKIY